MNTQIETNFQKTNLLYKITFLCFRSLGHMSLLFGQVVRGMSAGARVFEYLVIQPTIPVTGGTQMPLENIHGQVDFKNVTFSYPTRPTQTVLKDFTLSMPAGKMVALCGSSGAGKSTVAALLERFYDVDSGCISVDDHDITSLDPTWLRGAVIGFIHQVFNGLLMLSCVDAMWLVILK